MLSHVKPIDTVDLNQNNNIQWSRVLQELDKRRKQSENHGIMWKGDTTIIRNGSIDYIRIEHGRNGNETVGEIKATDFLFNVDKGTYRSVKSLINDLGGGTSAIERHLEKLDQQIKDIEEEFDDMLSDLNALTEKVNTVEDKIETMENDITDIISKDTEQDGRLDNHDTDINNIKLKDTEQDGRLDAIESEIASQIHFRGYFELINQLPTDANVGDYAWVQETETRWDYDEVSLGWTNSGEPIPPGTTYQADNNTLELINGNTFKVKNSYDTTLLKKNITSTQQVAGPVEFKGIVRVNGDPSNPSTTSHMYFGVMNKLYVNNIGIVGGTDATTTLGTNGGFDITSRNIVPYGNNAYNVGSVTFKYNTGYINYLQVIETSTVKLLPNSTAGTQIGQSNIGFLVYSKNIIPDSNNAYDIGSSSLKYTNSYVSTTNSTVVNTTNLYTKNIYPPTGTTAGIIGASDTGYHMYTRQLVPDKATTHHIGSSSMPYKNAYFDYGYFNRISNKVDTCALIPINNNTYNIGATDKMYSTAYITNINVTNIYMTGNINRVPYLKATPEDPGSTCYIVDNNGTNPDVSTYFWNTFTFPFPVASGSYMTLNATKYNNMPKWHACYIYRSGVKSWIAGNYNSMVEVEGFYTRTSTNDILAIGIGCWTGANHRARFAIGIPNMVIWKKWNVND
jgi:archaellum component FlaC